jgi:hypothetical protein
VLYLICSCPLCDSDRVALFHQDKQRKYFHCAEQCRLIFVDPAVILSPEAEKKRYEQHVNSPTDAGYRSFLQKLAHPLNAMLLPRSIGLDFGCGPGPTLSLILEELGDHQVALYDPYFYPDCEKRTNINEQNAIPTKNTNSNAIDTEPNPMPMMTNLIFVPNASIASAIETTTDATCTSPDSESSPSFSILRPRMYDFVTCTEAIEHFTHPMKEWTLLLSLLKPAIDGNEEKGIVGEERSKSGGLLGIMTKLASHDEKTFSNWWYKRDPTHVSFFSRETFAWLADRDALELTIIGDDVIILQKKLVSGPERKKVKLSDSRK